jgi:hypothetical protein
VAKLSKWTIFLRAFLVVFLSASSARVVAADEGERAAWAEAQRLCSADAFFTYLSRYPSGEHVGQALSALSELGGLQVLEGEAFSNFCLNPVRKLTVVPAPILVQAPPSSGESTSELPNDPY